MSKRPNIYRTARQITRVNQPVVEQARAKNFRAADQFMGEEVPETSLKEDINDYVQMIVGRIASRYLNWRFRRQVEAWRGDVTVERTSKELRSVGKIATFGLADTVVYPSNVRVPAINLAAMLNTAEQQWDGGQSEILNVPPIIHYFDQPKSGSELATVTAGE